MIYYKAVNDPFCVMTSKRMIQSAQCSNYREARACRAPSLVTTAPTNAEKAVHRGTDGGHPTFGSLAGGNVAIRPIARCHHFYQRVC